MQKSLKRLLDRLRTATNGRFHRPTSTRGGLRQPQRLQTVPVRARPRPRG